MTDPYKMAEESTNSVVELSDADWAYLPHVVLCQIFQNLSSLERLSVSCVCQSWYTAVNSGDTWKDFDFSEEDIDNWNLDPGELKNGPLKISESSENQNGSPRLIFLDIIKRYGKYFESLSLKCIGLTCFELVDALHRVCQNLKGICLQNISNTHQEAVCSLLQKNKNVTSIHVVSVKFNSKNEPLPIGLPHALTLRKLYLVNSFQSYNFGTLMYLVNLKELSIEPQLLSYSLLHHLVGRSLTDLFIVALSKITEFYQEAIQDWHWKEICKQGPKFRVHFRFSSSHEWTEKGILLKPSIPVESMIYFKYRLVHFIPLKSLLLQYSSSLRVFIDTSIAMASYDAARTDKDIDGMNKCLLDIVSHCQHLRVFAVKEVLASSTVLAMVSINRNLTELYVMEDQLIFENLIDVTNLPDGISADINENWTKFKFELKMTEILGKPWRSLPSEEYFRMVRRHCSNFI